MTIPEGHPSACLHGQSHWPQGCAYQCLPRHPAHQHIHPKTSDIAEHQMRRLVCFQIIRSFELVSKRKKERFQASVWSEAMSPKQRTDDGLLAVQRRQTIPELASLPWKPHRQPEKAAQARGSLVWLRHQIHYWLFCLSLGFASDSRGRSLLSPRRMQVRCALGQIAF